MSFTVRPLRAETPPPRRSYAKLIGLGLLKASGPLIQIGHIWHEKQEQRKKQEHRVNLLKRVLVVLVAVFCAILLFAGTAKALISLKILSLQSFVNVAGSDLPTDEHGHTNVLLLGQGDAGHDGVDLTDTIMVASLDPMKTKSAVLLSLPRDLYFLETENMGKGRINSLYRDYKAQLKREGQTEEEASRLAMKELANEIGIAMNMEIHHIVKVDFIGFVQAVDAIGGIDIVVPETLVDTEYPGPNYTYETFSIEAGPQHIDGETALKYARSRHSTSDFDRSRRQQQILKAIGDRVQSEGLLTRPGQIMDLLDIMNEHVESTLELRSMVSLAGAGKELDRDGLISMQLNTENGLYGSFSQAGGLLYTPPRDQFGGAAVLLPVSVPENPVTWKRLQLLVDLVVHRREVAVEQSPIRIYNAGAAPGSAKRLGGELIRFGFNVVTMENSPSDEDKPESIIKGREDSPTFQALSPLVNLIAEPIPAPQPSSAMTEAMEGMEQVEVMPEPIVIELGSEYEYAPLKTSPSAPQE